MKKIILLSVLLVSSMTLYAQNKMQDTFDDNKLGWTETVTKDTKALIEEGVMRLQGKNAIGDKKESIAITSCYIPIDPTANFTIKCRGKVKKLNSNGYFGILIDYMDDYNYSAFYIMKGEQNNGVVMYNRVINGELVGKRVSDVKFHAKKDITMEFEIKSLYEKLEFKCNGMQVVEIRYNPIKYAGMGFAVFGDIQIDFDDLEILQ